MQVSDLSPDQQQELAMQQGAVTPEDMKMVLGMLAQNPEALAVALQQMGVDVSPEEIQNVADWMDQNAGASAGMPPESEQSEGDASAAADVDDSGAPPDTASAAPIPDDEAAEAEGETIVPAGTAEQGEAEMPRGGPPAEDMDDVVSASLMKGAPGPAPTMKGSPNFSKMKGPAGLKQPRSGNPGKGQEANIMALMQKKSKSR
jgi:hypothetical protein